MSLLKLAALGAEVLDILERNEEWNSDTFDIIQTRISLLGLSGSDEEGMFKVDPEHKDAARHLYEDYERSVDKEKPICLEIESPGEYRPQIYTGGTFSQPSKVMIRIGKRDYEL